MAKQQPNGDNVIDCICYILHNFKPMLLNNTFISTYTQGMDYIRIEDKEYDQSVISSVKNTIT